MIINIIFFSLYPTLCEINDFINDNSIQGTIFNKINDHSKNKKISYSKKNKNFSLLFHSLVYFPQLLSFFDYLLSV